TLPRGPTNRNAGTSRAEGPRGTARPALPRGGPRRCDDPPLSGSSAAALDVADPRSVERGPVHASPAGREVPAGRRAVAEVVARGHVVERLRVELVRVLAHPVQGGVREAHLAQALLLEVLVDQRYGSRPERGPCGCAAELTVATAEEDAKAGEWIAVGGDVGDLAQAPAHGLRLLPLVVRQAVEDARAAAATALVDGAAPGVL